VALSRRQGPTIHPLLRMAACTGVAAVVESRLEHGDAPDARDNRGQTALMLAAQGGHAAVCRVLLARGADASARDRDGRDALALAVAGNHTDVIAILTSQHRQPVTVVVDQPDEPHGADDDGFDFSGWEAEPEVVAPNHDPSVEAAASALQASIAQHVPIDRDEPWDDVALSMPRIRKKHPRRRVHDLSAEACNAIHALLLEGIEHGIVSRRRVEDLAEWMGEEGTERDPKVEPDFDAPGDHEALMRHLLLEAFERLDVRVEDFEPWLDALDATPSGMAEQLAEEALEAIQEQRQSHLSGPAGLYAYVNTRLIDRPQEVALAQAMEVAQRAVVDALLQSPKLADRLVNFSVNLPPGPAKLAEPFISIFGSRQSKVLTSEEWASVAAARSVVTAFVASLGRPSGPTAVALVEAARQWHEAWEQLVVANLRLVPFKVKKFWKGDVLVDELIQAGCFGLMRAAEMFDHTRGLTFGTYALNWIASPAQRMIAEDGLIRVPSHIGVSRSKVVRTWRQLGEPDVACMGDNKDFEDLDSASLDAVAEATGVERATAGYILRSALGVLAPDEGLPEAMALPCESTLPADEVRWLRELRAALASSLAQLPPRNAQVVLRRYGLYNGVEETLEEVGAAVGITRERARQIQVQVLEKLALDSRLQQFIESRTSDIHADHVPDGLPPRTRLFDLMRSGPPGRSSVGGRPGENGPHEVVMGEYSLAMRDTTRRMRMTLVLTTASLATRNEISRRRGQLHRLIHSLAADRPEKIMVGATGRDRFLSDLVERFANFIHTGPLERMEITTWAREVPPRTRRAGREEASPSGQVNEAAPVVLPRRTHLPGMLALDTRIDAFELSLRAHRALAALGITIAADLLRLTHYDLHRLSNCGRRTIDEIMGLQARVARRLEKAQPVVGPPRSEEPPL
jgi:RNA polymerase primary sigma factor